MIGVMPSPSTALTFLLTISSVSPSTRGAQVATITRLTLSLASIGGDTSRCRRPEQWQFWAPSRIYILSDSITVWSERRFVNGGCTDVSTDSASSW